MNRFLLLFAFALVPALAAEAQTHVRQVRAQLNYAADGFAQRGVFRSHDDFIGSLYDNGETTFTVDLQGGRAYTFLGACDNDCSDVDLWIYDERGNLIDSDVSRSDLPYLSFTPRWSARFSVRVRMYACSYEPCSYGVAAFGG